MRNFKILLTSCLCAILATVFMGNQVAIRDAHAAGSLSKKQQEARDHQRKRAGRVPQRKTNGEVSSSNRKGIKNSSNRRNSSCEARLARSVSRARCVYDQIKSISAFK